LGDKEVVRLATLCHLDSAKALGEFREYKNNTKVVGKVLSSLLQRISMIPISSAECERGFSCISMNKTDVRNCLTVETFCSLIFIKVNGPSPVAIENCVQACTKLKTKQLEALTLPIKKGLPALKQGIPRRQLPQRK
jgi:hypothetical protein